MSFDLPPSPRLSSSIPQLTIRSIFLLVLLDLRVAKAVLLLHVESVEHILVGVAVGVLHVGWLAGVVVVGVGGVSWLLLSRYSLAPVALTFPVKRKVKKIKLD